MNLKDFLRSFRNLKKIKQIRGILGNLPAISHLGRLCFPGRPMSCAKKPRLNWPQSPVSSAPSIY